MVVSIGFTVMVNIHVSDKSFRYPSLNNLSADGFTVIETLISILLLAITLVGSLSIYFNADRVTTFVGHKKMAAEIVNSRMEELRRLDYDLYFGNMSATYALDASNESDSAGQNFNDTPTSPPLTIGDLEVTARTINVTNVPLGSSPTHKKVTGNVSWTEANQAQPREFEITSFITP